MGCYCIMIALPRNKNTKLLPENYGTPGINTVSPNALWIWDLIFRKEGKLKFQHLVEVIIRLMFASWKNAEALVCGPLSLRRLHLKWKHPPENPSTHVGKMIFHVRSLFMSFATWRSEGGVYSLQALRSTVTYIHKTQPNKLCGKMNEKGF